MAKKSGIFILSSWLSLGFYRGTKYYGHDYKKDFIKYEEKKDNKYYTLVKPQYFYTHSFCFGLFGMLLYTFPITVVLVIPKEIYRLEVNIRGLNEEKENDKYYQFF
jgi:hypothetical protein